MNCMIHVSYFIMQILCDMYNNVFVRRYFKKYNIYDKALITLYNFLVQYLSKDVEREETAMTLGIYSYENKASPRTIHPFLGHVIR